jgi:hypothetical protein
MTSIKKIGKEVLNTLGWLTFPGLVAAIKYSKNNDDAEEPTVFGATTLFTVLSLWGLNAGYGALFEKEYLNQNKNISITVEPNAAVKHNFKYYATYFSPVARIILIGTSDDKINIKTTSLEAEISNSKTITFDENKGFFLNKETYYTSDFKLSNILRLVEDDSSERYSPKEINKIFKEYENLKQQSEIIKEKALDTGHINKVAELENKLKELEHNYEFGRSRLKNAQIRMDTELTKIVDQLNTEYFAYKNTPMNTAIPGRDYDLSNITK